MVKKNFIGKCALVLAMISMAAGLAFTSSAVQTITPDEALRKLMDGNKAYVENKMSNAKMSGADTRASLVKSQKPYAIILSCSDSRIPPEIVFDKGLGELFVVRVAGNVVDPIILGSIEYAAEHLGSPLIMVLGHERCGAVTAAVGAKGKPEGNIGEIVKAIKPAVKAAKANDCAKEELVECAITANIKQVAASLTKKSKILKHLAMEGKVKIVPAKYDLDDGKVTLLK